MVSDILSLVTLVLITATLALTVRNNRKGH